MWSTGTAPSGWLICNGATIGAVGSGATHESASYSQLFDLVKGTSGSGLYGNTGTESLHQETSSSFLISVVECLSE